jgi:DNA-binding HxlR family transcriptional regulator
VLYSHCPLRAEYHLTEEDRRLGAVLDSVANWGMAHFPGTRRLGVCKLLTFHLQPAGVR